VRVLCFGDLARRSQGLWHEQVTPYQRAAQAWDDRIGSARVQAKNWRLAFFGTLALSGALTAGIIWQGGYRISGDKPDWRPVRVFDDGVRTFIEFPESIARGDMPPVFVLGASGDGELVNYRVAERHIIVDRLFAEAELRMGDRRSKQRVRITRDGRERR
jgi:type IV secretory pathway VirB9-like protein